jgi:predicted DNA-binding protein
LLQLLDYLPQHRRFFAFWMLTNQSIIPSVKKFSLRATEPNKYGFLHYWIASLKRSLAAFDVSKPLVRQSSHRMLKFLRSYQFFRVDFARKWQYVTQNRKQLLTLLKSVEYLLMATVFIGARIPPALSEKLSEFVNRVGATKSEILTAALVQYLGATEDLPLSLRMVELEKRMAALEARVYG